MGHLPQKHTIKNFLRCNWVEPL